VDLNRQVLLVAALTILTPAVVGHAVRPRHLARTIRGQGALPGSRTTPWVASAYSAGLILAELGVAAVAAVSLAGDTTRPAGALISVAGLGFVAYVGHLLAHGYDGDCGCTPLTATVTRLSLVPGAALLVIGLALVPDAAFDDAAFARTSGALQTSLAVGAAVVLGALVALLPATALTGDPLVLRAEEG
jgi:methylamine utilization protein MauE